jgi:PAS domain S-box-containing protein
MYMGISANPFEVPHPPGLSDAILEFTESAIAVLDPLGRVVRWNKAVAAISGISAQETLGCLFPVTVLIAEDRQGWNCEFERVAAGLPSVRCTYRWKQSDGSVLPLVCSSAAIRDDVGEIALIAITVTRNAATGLDPALSGELIRERFLERRDLSRFLHGTISQNLVALSFSVSKLEAAVHASGVAADVNPALDLIDRCCRDVRIISYMLAPPFSSEGGLDSAIESFVEYLRDEAGLTIALSTVPVPQGISPDLHSLFFAAVQEWAARAIRKYPKAHLSIKLQTAARSHGEPGGAPEVVLELESTPGAQPPGPDDVSRVPDAILDGWAMFRARVRDLGGQFEVQSCPARSFARLSFQGVGQG